jgi:hypothetical protein
MFVFSENNNKNQINYYMRIVDRYISTGELTKTTALLGNLSDAVRRSGANFFDCAWPNDMEFTVISDQYFTN